MRRTVLLGVALALLLVPAPAIAADTNVERENESVGSVVSAGAGRWVVENLDYTREAEIRRQGNRRFNFVASSRTIGYVTRVTARRWNVFSRTHSEPIGYVEKVGTNRWRAYVDQAPVGQATGSAAVQGAASVLLIFHN